MNEPNPLTIQTLSPEIYKRGMWAVSICAVVAVFFFTCWLGVERRKTADAMERTIEVQRQVDAAHQELSTALQERGKMVSQLHERLAKSEAARMTAEKEAREIAINPSKVLEPPAESAGEPRRLTQTATPGPNAQELTRFIKTHLAHMVESVEAQSADYADEVDFHDKPHASRAMIESERSQWVQKFPARTIFVNEIQPRLSANQDTDHGWVATAVFDWRWEYRTRSGAVLRGVTRDSWKIAPSPQGLKIISEHSVDPATGRVKD